MRLARDNGTGEARPLFAFNVGQMGLGSRCPPCRILLPDVLLLRYVLLLLRCLWPIAPAAVLILLLLLLKLLEVVVMLLLLLLLLLLLRILLIVVVVLLLVLLLMVLLLLRRVLRVLRLLRVLYIRRKLRVRRMRIAVRGGGVRRVGGVILSVRVSVRVSGRVVSSVQVGRRRARRPICPVALRGCGQAARTHAAGRVVSRGGVATGGQSAATAAAAARAELRSELGAVGRRHLASLRDGVSKLRWHPGLAAVLAALLAALAVAAPGVEARAE